MQDVVVESTWRPSTTYAHVDQGVSYNKLRLCRERSYMAGSQFSSVRLNNVLLKIVQLLHQYQIKNWFIGYGTLLGIVRADACIENDDDVDILIEKSELGALRKMLNENNIRTTIKKEPRFLKVQPIPNEPTVDFYICERREAINYHDPWENVLWSHALPIQTRVWNGVDLHLPSAPEAKLANRYGADWRVPQKSKGVSPKQRII
jgi:hypothetical protein